MNRNGEQILSLKSDIIVTALDDEGSIFDLETRKTFWLNESACYLFQIFKKSSDGFPLSLTKLFLSAKYNNINMENVSEDIDCFINDLKRHNLLSTQLKHHHNSIRIRNFSNKKIYTKPIMEEDFKHFPITRAAVRTRVSPAVRQARRSGQRSF